MYEDEIPLSELRSLLSAMRDPELLRFGKVAKYMLTLEANAAPNHGAYSVRLAEARAEWVRRHAGTVIEDSF
jgi:hypothetical protein